MDIPMIYAPAMVGAVYLALGLVSNWISEARFKREMKRRERQEPTEASHS